MKKILVTSKDPTTGYSGAIELVYGEMQPDNQRRLLLLDMRGANLNDRQLHWVMGMAPREYGAGYIQNWGTDKLHIVEADMELDFEEDFWKPYDRKVNKERCQKEWDKLSRVDRAAAVHGLGAYLRHLSQNTWRPKKDPEGFFKNKMWKTDWDNLKS